MSESRRPSAHSLRCVAAGLAWSCLLAGCGDGSGEAEPVAGNPLSAPAPATVTPACGSTGGIEGGGRSKISGVVSQVAADGQLTLGNLRLATTGATFIRDGVGATLAAIESGQVVTVAGEIDLARQTGCAQSVASDAAIIGAVEYIDADARVLQVLGRQIVVKTEASFGPGVSLQELRVGTRVRVSGASGLGSIVASRIDLADLADGYFVAGPIVGLDAARKEFLINGIRVDYSAAAIAGPLPSLRDGNPVRVWGNVLESDESLPSSTIIRPGRVDLIEFGLTIQPAPAFAAPSESIQFSAWGVMGAVNWRVLRGDGSSCNADECGRIDTDGRYSAPGVAPRAPLLIQAASTSDPALFATTTVEFSQDPVIAAGPHTLRGIVADPDGPIAAAAVNVWVQQPRFGYSYWWANGPLYADGSGQFVAPKLPVSRVSVFVAADGYVQPCAVTAEVASDVNVSVPLFPVVAFDSSAPPRPSPAPEPSVTGQVYEMTPAGRQAVAGASVWLEDPLGVLYANTLTDREGEYFICNVGNLPSAAWVTVVRPGFQMRSAGPVDAAQSSGIDIELMRSSP